MIFVITKSCNPFLCLWFYAFPSKCRGGCAIGFVIIPLSEEVIVGVLAWSLIPKCEVIVVWLSAYPSKCRGDCIVPCL